MTLQSKKYSIKFRLLAFTILASILLMAVKFIAYYFTQSIAILTDALESIVNILAGSFALYSIWLSERPKDPNHPYGHGKIEFLSAGLEGLLIFVAGGSMIAKAVEGFFYPPSLRAIDIGIYLSTFAGLANFLLGWFLVQQGKKHQSLTLIADGRHLKSDAYSSAALVIGLAVIYFTKIYWLDSLVAIAFGVFIGYHGILLVRQAFKGVMDEVDTDLVDKVLKILQKGRKYNWIDIHNLRIIQYGSKLHIDCHLTLPFYYTLSESHEEVKNIEDTINQAIPDTEVFIHTDPCLPPDSCAICSVEGCPFRQQTQQTQVIWNINNIQKNQKHHH